MDRGEYGHGIDQVLNRDRVKDGVEARIRVWKRGLPIEIVDDPIVESTIGRQFLGIHAETRDASEFQFIREMRYEGTHEVEYMGADR